MTPPPPIRVAQADPRASYLAQKSEIDSAIQHCLSAGRYILGEEVACFEREFAAFQDAAHGIAVASGTAALQLALRAAGIRPGDMVATVSHTAVATVAAIELIGAIPFLLDVDDFYTLDPQALASAAASNPIRAVIPVHLYGQMAAMPEILTIAARDDMAVIEDCAQAHGARLDGQCAGRFSVAAAFSLYPTKNLGAFGDGGIVTTDDPSFAARLRSLREYGWGTQRYISEIAGDNSRLDELQAAILRVKLTRLAADNARRAEIASAYDAALAGSIVEIPLRRQGADHVFHQYVVACGKRDRLRDLLTAAGVGTNIHYPVPVHRQPAYRGRIALGTDACARTEHIASRILSLPIFPQMSEEDIAFVCDALKLAAARL